MVGAATILVACGGSAIDGGGSGGAGGDSSTASTTDASTGTCAGADCTTVTATTTATTSTGMGGQGAGGSGQGGATQIDNAMSLLISELPDPGTGSGTSVSSGGGPSPNTVLVYIGGNGLDCNNPGYLDCGNQWSFSFGIPPEMQQPGTYDLQDLNGIMSETGDGPGPECSFGGGTFWDGTVEITSIDDNEVVGTVSASPSGWANDPSGPFVAPRCF